MGPPQQPPRARTSAQACAERSAPPLARHSALHPTPGAVGQLWIGLMHPLHFQLEAGFELLCALGSLLVRNLALCALYAGQPVDARCVTWAARALSKPLLEASATLLPRAAAAAAAVAHGGGADADAAGADAACALLARDWTSFAAVQLALGALLPLAVSYGHERWQRRRFLATVVPGLPLALEMQHGWLVLPLAALQALYFVFFIAHVVTFGSL